MLQATRSFDLYQFPVIEEEDHKFSRLSSSIIAICVAILPFTINMVWRVYANTYSSDEGHSIFADGITDLALAGLVIAVSTFTNTYFSVKLLGWQSVSWRTFGSLLAVTITSLFSFVAYLLSIHNYILVTLKDKAFLVTLFLVFSCIIWSYIAHYCFLEDEFRGARQELRKLPDRN